VAAVSLTVRTYIKRRANNSVTLWRGNGKHAGVKGDMSADDIVKILQALEGPNGTGPHDGD
jgi:hypothetical protein